MPIRGKLVDGDAPLPTVKSISEELKYMSRLCCLSMHFVLLVAWCLPVSLCTGQDEPVDLFNGKDFTGWLTREGKPEDTLKVGTAKVDPDDPAALIVEPGGNELINFRGSGKDFYSEAKFGDAMIELEFMVPKGSNSGIYVMGEYEVQILDSFGKEKVEASDVGGLYGAQAPRMNAAKPPGEWQTMKILFVAPRFDKDGKKTSNANFIGIMLNDKLIQENVEMKGPTPSGLTGKEAPEGPLMLQGDHGPVAFRNIKVTPARFGVDQPGDRIK